MNALLHLLLFSFWASSVFGIDILESWNFLEYEWPSSSQKSKSMSDWGYKPTSVVPIGVLVAEETFLSIPRDNGVPASLVTLGRRRNKGGGPLLRAFPNWDWAGKECKSSIISVYRVDYDTCGRLWVLDNGKVGEKILCPPKIMAFSVKTRKLLISKDIPKEYAFNKNGTGLLVTPMVLTAGIRCQQFRVFMADIEGYALVVWYGNDEFRRFESKVFAPTNPNFTLNNESFYLADGIAGMALAQTYRNPTIYFSALASPNMYHVELKETNFKYEGVPNYVHVPGDYNSRRVSLVAKDYSIYFCSLEDNALMTWDTRTKFTKSEVKTLEVNSTVLQFVSDLKSTSKGDLAFDGLYGLSNRYQKTAAGTRNISETNFYIFAYKF